MGFYEYLLSQINTGYEEGKRNQEFSGRTFHGYYAYLAGKNNEPKPKPLSR